MKNSLKALLLIMVLVTLHSCGSISTYDAPLEPGQTVYQRQGGNTYNNNNRNYNTSSDNIPEPGQTEMKSQNDNSIPEPGQTEMKSNDDNNNDNVPEPGQTEMKDQGEE